MLGKTLNLYTLYLIHAGTEPPGLVVRRACFKAKRSRIEQSEQKRRSNGEQSRSHSHMKMLPKSDER